MFRVEVPPRVPHQTFPAKLDKNPAFLHLKARIKNSAREPDDLDQRI